jgi:cytochrome c peroxidase
MRLSNGQRFGGSQCHGGVNLTVSHQDTQQLMSQKDFPFFNIGLYNVDGTGSYPADDQEIFDLAGNVADQELFLPL